MGRVDEGQVVRSAEDAATQEADEGTGGSTLSQKRTEWRKPEGPLAIGKTDAGSSDPAPEQR
ncbi:hypothetical protein NYR55_06795 [Sphingomonas sp. BGYR3]|uniref:hypothetical protein n=1 Tax=Sphingomonas sp. BGYR3 TaxID=2975483 RepID=UPI0021A82709|nr:hypothetical protein [Sphingomonas sp. BGYR3]MDG5488325.1 hypothetical protein [Sphingomonas sp. BGYR3]